MKSAEYVALVTGVYRAALDRALARARRTYEVREGELSVLDEAFSRGLTEAYLIGERGNEMMSYRRPNNRGVLVGRVASVQRRAATHRRSIAQLDAEDTVEVWTSRGRFAQRVGQMTLRRRHVRSAPAERRRRSRSTSPCLAGDRVFRVATPRSRLLRRARFADESGATGIPLACRRTRGRRRAGPRSGLGWLPGRRGCAEGPEVERARTRAVTAEDVAEHVGRLGGTAFAPASWDVALSPDAGIGFSALHRVRRDAIEDYEADLLVPWADRAVAGPKLPFLPRPHRNLLRRTGHRRLGGGPARRPVRVCRRAARPCTCPRGRWATDRFRAASCRSLPRVCHDRETDRCARAGHRGLDAWSRPRWDSWTSRSGAERESRLTGRSTRSTRTRSPSSPSSGRSFVWLSPELSSRQIAEVTAESAGSGGHRGVRATGSDGDRALRADGRGGVRSALRFVQAQERLEIPA